MEALHDPIDLDLTRCNRCEWEFKDGGGSVDQSELRGVFSQFQPPLQRVNYKICVVCDGVPHMTSGYSTETRAIISGNNLILKAIRDSQD